MAKLTSTTIYGSANVTGNTIITGNTFISSGSGVVIGSGNTGVTQIVRSAAGSNYTSAPTLTISPPTTFGGVTATANAVMSVSGTPITINNAGSGYTVNDTLTIVGGVGTAATLTVATANGTGAITSATLTGSGSYTTCPTSPVSVTGGTGSSATFTLVYNLNLNQLGITNPGSGYVDTPTITFTGGGGTSAAAYAVVGFQSSIKSIGKTGSASSLGFYTPGGLVLSLGDPSNTAVNYWQMYGAGAGGGLSSYASGSDASISLNFISKGSQSINFATNSSSSYVGFRVIDPGVIPVNYLQVSGNSSGGSTTLSSGGSDTNIGININPKGNGSVNIVSTATSTSNTTGALRVTGGLGVSGNVNVSNTFSIITESAGNRPFTMQPGISGSQGARFGVQNESIDFYTTGGYPIWFATNGPRSAIQLAIATTSTPVNYLQVAGNTTGNGPVLSGQGSDTNVGINITPKGAGSANITSTTTSTSNTSGALVVRGGIGVSGNVYSNSFITSTDNSNYVARLDGFGGSGPRFELGSPANPSAYMIIGAYNNINNFETRDRNFRLGSTAVPNIMQANAATGVVTFANNVIISGNLTIVGNVSSENVQSLSVADPLIKLGIGNYTSDLRDIGFAAHYNDGTNAHTGFIRDSGTKEYYVFQGYTPELDSNNNVIITDASFRLANVYSSYFKGNTGAGMYFPNGALNTGFTANGKTALILESPGTGSQGNYIRVKGSSPVSSPAIIAEGADAHIGLNFYATGTLSSTNFYNNAAAIGSSTIQFQINNNSTGPNYLSVSGNTAGGNPTISALGTDTNIGITLKTARNGSVNVISTGQSSANLNIYGPGESVSSSQLGAVLNINSSSGIAKINVVASGSCTSSQLVVSSISIGSEANVFISSTGSFTGGFNAPASQKIYSPYNNAQLQVEGNTATLNVISTSGSGNPATLQILCANGGMFGTGTSSLKIASDYGGRSYANIGGSSMAASQVNIISSLPSTSTTTGALVVTGGIAASGNVWANSVYTTSSSGAVYTDNLRYSANGQPWVMGSAGGGATLSGYRANTVIVANASGYLSNSNSYFTASNNAMFVTGQIYSNNQDVMVTSLMYSVAFG